MMTTVAAQAMMPTAAFCLTMFRRLSTDRNDGDVIDSTMNRTMKTTMIP